MAIHIDQEVCEAVARRRVHGRSAALALHVAAVPRAGHALAVDWADHGAGASVEQRHGDVVLYVDERIARYAQWHDVAISAWRLGPLRYLGVVQEPRVLWRLVSWEKTHRPRA